MMDAEVNKDYTRAVIKSAARSAGMSVAELAEQLGLTRQAVEAWPKVPAKHIIAVESITGASRRKLRPDLYGPRRAR